jgi:hypothetical protein
MTNVLRVLAGLPHRAWEHEPQFGAAECYPAYAALAAELRPRTVLEIGAFEGYGLTAFWLGAGSRVRRLDWVDNESYLAGSNAHCRENLTAVGAALGWPLPALDGVRERGALGWRGRYDLVHVDGSHVFADALADLAWSWGRRPRVILVDDYDFLPEVRRAAEVFGAWSGLRLEYRPSLRGWALFRVR